MFFIVATTVFYYRFLVSVIINVIVVFIFVLLILTFLIGSAKIPNVLTCISGPPHTLALAKMPRGPGLSDIERH